MNITKSILLGFLIFCCAFVSIAQKTPTAVPLKQVLTQLGTKHGYTFNYSEATVAGFKLIPPSETLTLQEALDELAEQTELEFTVLQGNFVSVEASDTFLICGYLKDALTQEGIPLATVEGIIASTVTDENGYFSLAVSAKKERITLRHVSYAASMVLANRFIAEGCNEYLLYTKKEDLSEVLITSYLVQGINKLDNGALQINFNNFTILPGLIETDVLQAVQALPGVQSINETVSNINIRGGTNDQNLVRWDGIKMYQTGHFFGLISAFNPHITQKVTIQKNGTAASVTDGVSGSITMETEDEVNQSLELSAGVNLIDANVFLDLPLGSDSSIQIGGRKSLNDVVTTPTYETYFTRIAQDTEVENNSGPVVNSDRTFDFYDTSLRWLYDISETDRLRVNFLYISNNLQFNENVTLDGDPTSRESSVAQNSLGAGIRYEKDWNSRWKSFFQLYESDYTLRAINANILDEQRFLQENVVSETGLKTSTTYALSENESLLFGYELIETKITNLDDVDMPLVRTLISEVVRTHSGYGQYRVRSKDEKRTLTAGVRYNYLDKFSKSIVEPRLSFVQKFLDHFSLEVAGEFKHQISSQVVNFQNDFLGIEKRRWQLSNDDSIPILISQQFSAGINFSNRGWLISAEAYYKQVDGITTQAQGFQNQFEFVKTQGSYDAVGADILLRKNIQQFSCWLSYSLMQSEYTFESIAPGPFPSNFDIPHNLTFGSSYRYDSLKLAAGINWRSGNPTTVPVVGNEIVDGAINFGPTNAERFEDYMRVDASVLYHFKIGNSEAVAGASVWNILNQTNTIGSFYRINTNNEVVENKQTALGITPNASFKITL